jgi:all-trans-retinol 13,14-reductase
LTAYLSYRNFDDVELSEIKDAARACSHFVQNLFGDRPNASTAMSREKAMPQSYDAIVIGSGLGGLSAAAALAGRGKQVLVLERLANFGGAATIYRHGALTMEASLHETDGDTVFSPQGPFARLGLAGAIAPIETDMFYEARGGALPGPIRVPHGLARAREELVHTLPASTRAIEKYLDEIERLYRSLHELEEMSARGPGVLVSLLFSGRLFELIGDARHTVLERFDALFGADEAAKFALGAPLGYFDDDPARLSFLLYAVVWSRFVESGSYYFKGGSRALTLALAKHVEDAGGDAIRNAEVREIVLDAKGAVAGVAYVDKAGTAHEALAPLIFGGAAPETLSQMLPQHSRKAFSAHFSRYESSISLFNVSLGLTRPAADFGVCAYSTFLFPDDMTRFAHYPNAAAVFSRAPEGRMPPFVIADYGRLDAHLREDDDPYFVSLCGADRLDWWAGLDQADEMDRRKRWIDALIADVDRRFPGFAGAVSQAEIATARTMKNRLGTPSGEVYGFRPTPSRLFGRPPSAATPIEGLWISSAYTVSGGYAGAMQGGLMAADAAMRSLRSR